MTTTDLRRWVAVGTGVGIEIGAHELQVTIARVRPNGIAVLGSANVLGYSTRPAAEWGGELLSFLKELGCSHIAATVLLPRREVLVRQIHLPGVSDDDLDSAVALQIDSLHPFSEDDVVYSFARIGKTPAVLVGITQREVINHYWNLFTEAGIKIASFTFSAVAVYSALRALAAPPTQGFIALHTINGDVEIYGESEARPIFSGTFDRTNERAITQAISELRLDPGAIPVSVEQILPKPAVFPPNHDPSSETFGEHALPYATAIASAVPWPSLSVNLLPPEHRQSSSRIRLIPSIVLATILTVLLGALLAESGYEKRRYLNSMQAKAVRIEPQARRVQVLDREIAKARARTQLLDDFRKHTRLDLDALNELTRLLQPPTWLTALEIQRDGIAVSGETDQAAALLRIIDGSPLFENSEFTMAPTRAGAFEVFSIRARRKGAK
jgi:Tfp pilus assembly protein PilN